MSTSRPEILLISADRGLIDGLMKQLTGFGYHLTCCPDVAAGLAAAKPVPPSVILVDGSDVSLPAFRKDPALRLVPILVLYPSGINCEEDCPRALDKGADGWLCKPISAKELVARIRAILRRQSLPPSAYGMFMVGDLRVDVGRHEVTVQGKPVELTKKEFQILHQLARKPDRVFGRDELLDVVWGQGAALEEHNLDVHVHALRRKIEPDPARPRFLVTVRGVGYKLRSGSEDVPSFS